MKTSKILINAIVLTAALALGAVAQTTEPAKPATAKQTTKPAKTKAAATPKSDEDIQKCITEKLEASPKLKADGFSASVSNGVATLTGTTKVAGHKGNAGGIAKSCGAKSSQNNITVEKATKMKTSGEEKKTGAAKKP